MNWKGVKCKWPCPNTGTALAGMADHNHKRTAGSQALSCDLLSGPLEYEAAVLITQPQHSVMLFVEVDFFEANSKLQTLHSYSPTCDMRALAVHTSELLSEK
jgi:hypothetical protein